MEAQRSAVAARLANKPLDNARGEEALRRLFAVAHRDSGQPKRIAKFLLGLYNGDRFPFDLTDLRGLDGELFDDCLLVLRMDFWCDREVHRYFEDGGAKFEALAEDWGIVDHVKLARSAKEAQ